MLRLVFVGKWKDHRLRDAASELEKRAQRLWTFSVEDAPEEPKALLARLKALAARGLLVSMDPDGRPLDSPAFAKWVTGSSRDIALVVWGASGPSTPLRALCAQSLSLSPQTASHELARLWLMEQVYRSACILKGHPFPK